MEHLICCIEFPMLAINQSRKQRDCFNWGTVYISILLFSVCSSILDNYWNNKHNVINENSMLHKLSSTHSSGEKIVFNHFLYLNKITWQCFLFKQLHDIPLHKCSNWKVNTAIYLQCTIMANLVPFKNWIQKYQLMFLIPTTSFAHFWLEQNSICKKWGNQGENSIPHWWAAG